MNAAAGIDAFDAQDVRARRGFGQHRKIAAGHHRQGDHRHIQIEQPACAQIADQIRSYAVGLRFGLLSFAQGAR